MALFLKQDEELRSQLQQKISAQMKERRDGAPKIESKKTEPTFLDNQHTTRLAGVVLVVAAVIIIAVLLWLVRP